MLELIIFIIVISWVLKTKRKKNDSQQAGTVRRNPQVTKQTPVKPAQKAVKPAQSKSVQGKPEEMSTMEMLEAKAKEDDREEMIERQRQNIENKKHYGHLNYAEKYIIGDSVPKGKKMVFCAYCNAENLIPAYGAVRDYNCYFCRENL